MFRDLLFNGLALGPALWLFVRHLRGRPFSAPLVLAHLGFVGACCFGLSVDLFGLFRNFAWVLFFQATMVLFALASVRRWRVLCLALAMSLTGVGLWAFQVEPRMLEISRMQVTSPKISEGFSIAVVADLQTDSPGSFERSVLDRLVALEPDMILLTGDYLQTRTLEEGERQAEKFRKIWLEAGVSAPMGVFAVQGDVDPWPWEQRFGNLGIQTSSTTTTFAVPAASAKTPLELVGLSLADSNDPGLLIAPTDRFRVVFGHRPDFALGRSGADLLIAGHTHGGQVRLPGIGPLITFSEVPRDWASGLTPLNEDQALVVSRGIGMERGEAPRLRFLCRPELVMIDVVPGAEPSAHLIS